MAADSGRLLKTAIGLESTYGTKANPAFPFAHGDVEFKRRLAKKMLEMSIGRMDKNIDVINEAQYAEGLIPGVIDSKTVGALLAVACQKKPVTSIITNGNSHVFERPTDDTVAGTSASVYRVTDNYNEVALGSRLSELYLDFQNNDFGMFGAKFMGLEPATNMVDLPLASDFLNHVRFNNVTLKMADNVAGLATATAIPSAYAKVLYSNPVKPYPIIGQTGVAEVLHTEGFTIKIEVKALFKNLTQRNNWLNNTNRYVRVEATFDVDDNLTPKITVDLLATRVYEWDDSQSIGDFVEETLTILGVFDPAATVRKTYTITLDNKQSTY